LRLIRGFWTATAFTPGPRNAAASFAPAPPQPITTPGKGPSQACGATAFLGLSHRLGEILFQGGRKSNVRTSGTSPAASAKPKACARKPAKSVHKIRAISILMALRRGVGHVKRSEGRVFFFVNKKEAKKTFEI
jgi:hypothetical protein